jgi:hypothetical protein
LNDTAKLCVGQLDVRLPRALHKEGGKARSKYSRTHAVNPVSMQRVESRGKLKTSPRRRDGEPSSTGPGHPLLTRGARRACGGPGGQDEPGGGGLAVDMCVPEPPPPCCTYRRRRAACPGGEYFCSYAVCAPPCTVAPQAASLCSGRNFWQLKGIPRLGLESVSVADGPHGLRCQENEADHLGMGASLPATCFPTAVTLAGNTHP